MMRQRAVSWRFLPAAICRWPGSISVMSARRLCVWVSGIAVFAAGLSAGANENWPQWRGPLGNGISDSKNLPTTWSLEKNENIVWKAALPSWSGGTPIIWGDHIFVTSPSKKNEAGQAVAASPEAGKGGKGGKAGGIPGETSCWCFAYRKKMAA